MEDLKLKLDFRHKIPLSDQVQNQLRGLIQSGILQTGDQLPTVRQLAAQLHINFNTVARAYRVLDEEGWISTQQGRGTYVLDESEHISQELQEVLRSEDTFPAPEEAVTSDTTDFLEAAASIAAAKSIDDAVSIDAVSNDSPTSSGTSTSAKPAASNGEAPSPETAEAAKANAINEWLERLLNEAAQYGMTVEELHHALSHKLTSPQASDESTNQKKIIKRAIKQSRKPLHQTHNPIETQFPPLRALHKMNSHRARK